MRADARPPPAVQIQQALALHRQGALAQAAAIYEAVLRADPRNFDALHLGGVLAAQSGNPAQAADLIGRAIAINAGNAAAFNNRGLAFKDLGQHQASLECFSQAIARKADYAGAYFNRGNAQMNLAQLDAALFSFDQACIIKPEYAEAWCNRGVVLTVLGRLELAVASLDRAIALKADYAEAHCNRAVALQRLKRYEAADASCRQAIELRPGYAEAHSNLGLALGELNEGRAALDCFDRAIALKPDFAEAHFNRGNLLRDLGESDAALASFDRAVASRPNFAEAHCNRGNLLRDSKQLDGALLSYELAIAARPEYAEPHTNRSMVLLLRGDFARGWSEYEWRWRNAGADTEIAPSAAALPPRWDGSVSLEAKTLLIYCEQGLGDTLQFSRYAGTAAAMGAKVILRVQPPLVRLANTLDGVSKVISLNETCPEADFCCPLMSLPLAFRTGLESIPAPRSYLASDDALSQQWARRLGEKRLPRIGLAWSGNPLHLHDRRRSIGLAELLKYLPDGFEYFCLHKDLSVADLRGLEADERVSHFTGELDFDNTAALCDSLDLVISVDTSLAHLSASLGRRTWILLSFVPDWRWLLDRTDSPWYPTVTLYRQETLDDWGIPLRRVAADLAGCQGWPDASD
jgi:tetratricopeptide (TPR) repeat protein